MSGSVTSQRAVAAMLSLQRIRIGRQRQAGEVLEPQAAQVIRSLAEVEVDPGRGRHEDGRPPGDRCKALSTAR